jgi:type IV secretion system protein VirB10
MTPPAEQEAGLARELRLRPALPRPVRLSPRAVAMTAGVAALAVAAVSGWALTDHRPPRRAEVPAPVAPPSPPDVVTALPRDYVRPRQVPPLGPPLGVWGAPRPGGVTGVARRRGEATPGDGSGQDRSGRDREAAERAQALQQARESRLFATGGPAPSLATAAQSAPPPPEPSGPAAPAPPQHLLRAGTVLRAVLLTGLRSDLPGPALAQVTAEVHDSGSGRHLLVPQGAQLVGAYDDKVGFGQSRLRVTWTSLRLPDGRAVALEPTPALDAEGRAGLAGHVDRRWGQRLAAAAVGLGLAAAGALGQTGEGDLARVLRGAAADTAAETAAGVVGRSLDVAPTISVPAGAEVRVVLARDLALDPWPAP